MFRLKEHLCGNDDVVHQNVFRVDRIRDGNDAGREPARNNGAGGRVGGDHIALLDGIFDVIRPKHKSVIRIQICRVVAGDVHNVEELRAVLQRIGVKFDLPSLHAVDIEIGTGGIGHTHAVGFGAFVIADADPVPAPVVLGSGVVQVGIPVEGFSVPSGRSRYDRDRGVVIEAARVLVPRVRIVFRREPEEVVEIPILSDLIDQTESKLVDCAIRHRFVPEKVDLKIEIPALVVVFFIGAEGFARSKHVFEIGKFFEHRGGIIPRLVPVFGQRVGDRRADVFLDDAVESARLAIADAGAGSQERRRAGRILDLVGVSQRLADVDALGLAVAGARAVFNERTNIYVSRETRVRDFREFDRRPVATAGRFDIVAVRFDRAVDRSRTLVILLRSIDFHGIAARREHETDRVILERTDRKKEPQIGLCAVFDVGADHRLVKEVLDLAVRCKYRICRYERRQERRDADDQHREEDEQGCYSSFGDTVFHSSSPLLE